MKTLLRLNPFFIYYLILSTVLLFFLRIQLVKSNTTDIIGIEQNVIYSIQVLLDNGNLYLSPAKAPFSITQYAPVYYYICALTAKIFGYNSASPNIDLLYTIGRSFNIIINLGMALLAYAIGKSIFKLSDKKVLFLLVLSFAYNNPFNFAVRPDSLCDMLGLASMYTFLKYYKLSGKSNFLWLVLTVVLSVLATFSKQSGIQLIIIFVGFSILKGDWKTFFKLAALSLLLYVLTLLLFTHLYESFLENVVGGIANGIHLKNFFKYVIGKNIFIVSVWPLILISIFLLLKNKSIFKGDTLERILAICLAGTLIFASVTGLKMGAGMNYFILSANLALIFIFNIIQKNELKQKVYSQSNNPRLKLAFYSYLALMISLYAVYSYIHIKRFDDAPLRSQRNSAKLVADFIKKDNAGGDFRYIYFNLTTDVILPSRQNLNNVFYKECLVPQRDILEYSTGPSKVFGYKNFEKLIATGAVKYIVESSPRSEFHLIEELQELEKTKYKLIKNIEGYLIYKLISVN